ncbi:hypothetical protein GF337_01385 [candidate division KSB1 bacterium]|nr:hypothetical protein [candidate division KSB1 bacterium]
MYIWYMNLRDKLKLIDSLPKVSGKKPVDFQKKADFSSHFDGEYLSTPFGECFVITRHFPRDYKHGSISLAEVGQIDPEMLALAGKDKRLKLVQPQNTLFFDTETTGLSSGAGTYIFLAGFGYFTEDSFVIKQYVMADYNEERAFLYTINELLKQFAGIVSYNGKSFDWNLLESRFIFSRLQLSRTTPLHLDLVHTARRIWRQRLPDCSLGSIERYVLDFFRNDDIPGYQIPSIYFQYLRDKEVEPLVPIIRHNEWDILSLAALLIHSAFIYADPQKYLSHHHDLESLAQSLENMKEWQRSVDIYEYLLAGISEKRRTNYLVGRLGSCYKRLQQWEKAVLRWEEMITNGYADVEPYIELAKYYEHQQRDFVRAIEMVNRAIHALELAQELGRHPELEQYKDELLHRRARNERKLNGRRQM